MHDGPIIDVETLLEENRKLRVELARVKRGPTHARLEEKVAAQSLQLQQMESRILELRAVISDAETVPYGRLAYLVRAHERKLRACLRIAYERSSLEAIRLHIGRVVNGLGKEGDDDANN
jgi:hypothetical protein